MFSPLLLTELERARERKLLDYTWNYNGGELRITIGPCCTKTSDKIHGYIENVYDYECWVIAEECSVTFLVHPRSRYRSTQINF